MKRKVIAIHGRMGAGKSTLAKNLQAKLSGAGHGTPVISSFAKVLKDVVTNIGFSSSTEHPGKDSYSPVLSTTFGLALQELGMVYRNIFGVDVWMKRWMESISDEDFVIVDDLRFENEVSYLRSLEDYGFDIFLIKISQVGSDCIIHEPISDGRDRNHISEQGLRQSLFDAVVYYRPDSKDIDYLIERMSKCGFLGSGSAS